MMVDDFDNLPRVPSPFDITSEEMTGLPVINNPQYLNPNNTRNRNNYINNMTPVRRTSHDLEYGNNDRRRIRRRNTMDSFSIRTSSTTHTTTDLHP